MLWQYIPWSFAGFQAYMSTIGSIIWIPYTYKLERLARSDKLVIIRDILLQNVGGVILLGLFYYGNVSVFHAALDTESWTSVDHWNDTGVIVNFVLTSIVYVLVDSISRNDVKRTVSLCIYTQIPTHSWNISSHAGVFGNEVGQQRI
jgi:hypothetical protein